MKVFVFVAVVAVFVVSAFSQVPPHPGKPRGTELTGDKIYTVVQGDTMWDICGRELKSPWLWPKVWERNPHIANPNWIYPEDRLDLNLDQPPKDAYIKDNNRDGEVKQFTFRNDDPNANYETPLPTTDKSRVSAYKSTPIEFVPPRSQAEEESQRNQYQSDMSPFILETGNKEFGKIIRLEGEGLSATMKGILYINKGEKNGVREGDEFLVYTLADSKVEHPVSFSNIGTMVKPSGKLKVVIAYKDTSKCEVVRLTDSMPIGSSIVYEYPKIVLSEKNIKANYEGYIVYLGEGVNNAGINQLVFIDRGLRQSVRAGMFFDVMTEKKYTKGMDGTIRDIPSQLKGRIKVISARENTATCIVVGVNNNETISVGDRIVVQ